MASTLINPNRSKKPKTAAASEKVPTQNDIKRSAEIENEYNYYVIQLRRNMLVMTDEERAKVAKWIHLLVNPLNSAQSLEVREKRNQYLFMLVCSLQTGTVNSFLKTTRVKHLRADKAKRSKFTRVAGTKIGASSAAPQIPTIADEHGFPLSLATAISPTQLTDIDDVFERAEWQNCRHWEQRLSAARMVERAKSKSSSKFRDVQSKKSGSGDSKKCSVHAGECPKDLMDSRVGKSLDKQFEYLLALAEDYKELLSHDAKKTTLVNLWLQALAEIDATYCAHMKGIRNDYIMILVGYLLHGEVKGPFEETPAPTLEPLTKAVATYLAKRKIEASDKSRVPLNPMSDTVEAFMNSVPAVEEGAFALLCLSGNLLTPTLTQPSS